MQGGRGKLKGAGGVNGERIGGVRRGQTEGAGDETGRWDRCVKGEGEPIGERDESENE